MSKKGLVEIMIQILVWNGQVGQMWRTVQPKEKFVKTDNVSQPAQTSALFLAK
jgi:hypothetical protein